MEGGTHLIRFQIVCDIIFYILPCATCQVGLENLVFKIYVLYMLYILIDINIFFNFNLTPKLTSKTTLFKHSLSNLR